MSKPVLEEDLEARCGEVKRLSLALMLDLKAPSVVSVSLKLSLMKKSKKKDLK